MDRRGFLKSMIAVPFIGQLIRKNTVINDTALSEQEMEYIIKKSDFVINPTSTVVTQPSTSRPYQTDISYFINMTTEDDTVWRKTR